MCNVKLSKEITFYCEIRDSSLERVVLGDRDVCLSGASNAVRSIFLFSLGSVQSINTNRLSARSPLSRPPLDSTFRHY